MTQVLIDTNIFIYAAGKPSPYKTPSINLLKKIAREELEAYCDTEVLQEVLYRHWHIKEFEKGSQMVKEILTVVPRILSVTREDVIKAVEILNQKKPGLQPRDAIHVAIMLNNGIETIYSYDRHFDGIEGIRRLEPGQ
jgi:predicted nucleic acid-binding protein